LLYTTSACTPHLVSVPLRDGIHKLRHLSELETLHWIDHLGGEKFNTTCCATETYNTGTDTNTYEYTLFCDHPDMFGAPNVLIREIASISRNEMDITGNVLVVKHHVGNKASIVDCTYDDIQHTNKIMIMYAAISSLCE
jgi:hypothetical protein